MGFRLEPPRSDVQTLFGDGRWSDDVPLCPSREDSKGPLYQEPHWSVDAARKRKKETSHIRWQCTT